MLNTLKHFFKMTRKNQELAELTIYSYYKARFYNENSQNKKRVLKSGNYMTV